MKLADGVVFRSFGAETVLLNLTTGQYHGLTGSGGRMLEVLDEVGDLDAAAQQLAGEFGVDAEVLRQDMAELCGSLLERGLIVVDGPE